MRTRFLFFSIVGTLYCLLHKSYAQTIPSYLPTNGLVSWWPFNGSLNDESGNGNNGILMGGSFSIDRYSNANSSFYGNGNGSGINIPTMNNFPFGNSDRTLSLWFKCDIPFAGGDRILFCYGDNSFGTRFGLDLTGTQLGIEYVGGLVYFPYIPDNLWHNIIVTYNGLGSNGIKLYLDGVLKTTSVSNPISTLNTLNSFIHNIGNLNNIYNFKGNLDDIGFWNRVLTPQEIADVFSGVICANNTTISPLNFSAQSGNNALFSAASSDSSPNFIWQSDFGQGFQTLFNYGNFSGVGSNTLTISNLSISNHNQKVRVISTSGNCIDTSATATIHIVDSCIRIVNDTNFINQTVYDTSIVVITDTNTINQIIYDTTFVTVIDTNFVTVTDTNFVTITDTNLVSVTDTLIINLNVIGINPPNNTNIIKIFPNPSSDHITIDYGNFINLSGYQLKITNSLGQQMFITSINQQSSYISLSTWTGNGIYFVHLIDLLGNTVEIRKIVLQ